MDGERQQQVFDVLSNTTRYEMQRNEHCSLLLDRGNPNGLALVTGQYSVLP